ncbi:MAG: baseplate assembly protein [Alphaproteobacteria bacterium]|nr:MAG: baseplate assembly protein [Alphaproteobacteria bacterium]
MSEAKRFYGKYRGTVVNNIDPLQTGRVMVQAPDVLGLNISSWAMPCFPVSGIQSGCFAVPQIGTGVWVEFEQGNPDYPIWTGCYYKTAAEVPVLALAAPPGVDNMVMQTTGQNSFMINDTPGPTGGILLKTTTGALISINDVGITISNGKGASILMAGPSVTINGGALVVT